MSIPATDIHIVTRAFEAGKAAGSFESEVGAYFNGAFDSAKLHSFKPGTSAYQSFVRGYCESVPDHSIKLDINRRVMSNSR